MKDLWSVEVAALIPLSFKLSFLPWKWKEHNTFFCSVPDGWVKVVVHPEKKEAFEVICWSEIKETRAEEGPVLVSSLVSPLTVKSHEHSSGAIQMAETFARAQGWTNLWALGNVAEGLDEK